LQHREGSHDDFDDDEDEEHESEEDEFPGKITHEGNKIQVMRNEERGKERATVEDWYKGHTDGTNLVYGLANKIDTFDFDFDYNEYKPPKGKAIAHKWFSTREINIDIIRY